MMKWLMIAASLSLLAGCGVDGEPAEPTVTPPNVNISPSGVKVGTGIGVGKGPLRVGLGLSI
ncbi:MAG: hypothetical protein ACSHWZ_14260 [Sulfitobacter sp.]